MLTKGAISHKSKSTFYFFGQHFVYKVLISNLVFRRAFKNTTTVLFFSLFSSWLKKEKRMNTKVLNRPVGYCMFYLCAEMKIGLSSLYFIYFCYFLFWFC